MKTLITLLFAFHFFSSFAQYEPWKEPQIPEIEEDQLLEPPPLVFMHFVVLESVNDSCFFLSFENQYPKGYDYPNSFVKKVPLGKDTLKKELYYNKSYSGGNRIYQITYFPDCRLNDPIIIRFNEIWTSDWPSLRIKSMPASPGYYEISFTDNLTIPVDYSWIKTPFEERTYKLTIDDQLTEPITE